MKRNLLLLGIAVLVLGGIFGGIQVHFAAPLYFEGKETFMSQEEYTAFKVALAMPEVEVKEMAALSSKPPIVVTFKVYVPRNHNFGFGICTGTADAEWLFILLLMPIAIMVSALIPNEEEEESQPS